MASASKVILFDLNETLIHQRRSERSHIASTYAALAQRRWEVTFESFEAAWVAVHAACAEQFRQGRSLLQAGELQAARKLLREPWYRENIAAMLALLSLRLPNRWVEEITWAYQDSWVGGLTMPPEYHPPLRALRQAGCRMGIVTNFQQANIIPDILEQFGLRPYFEAVAISSQVGVRKPHPDLFQVALQALGGAIDPACTYYVGDNYEEDVVGARYCGIQPVLVDKDGSYQGEAGLLRIGNLVNLPGLLSAA